MKEGGFGVVFFSFLEKREGSRELCVAYFCIFLMPRFFGKNWDAGLARFG